MALDPEEVDRRSVSRREDDRWLRALIHDLIVQHNRRARRQLLGAAVGYLILLVGVGIGLYTLEHRDANRARATARVARLADLAFCERINVLRHLENQTAEAAWATIYVSQQRERKLAKISPNPTTHRRSADALRFIGTQFHHTDPTDCLSAVDDPQGFKKHTPQPQSFSPRSSAILHNLIRLTGRPS